MNTYKLNTYSTTLHNLIVLVGVVVAMSCFGLVAANKQSYIVCFSTLFGVLGLAKLLAIKFSKATADFSISKEELSINWTKNYFILSRPNYYFRLADLEEYVIEPSFANYRMRLKTKEGKTIKFELNENTKDNESFNSFCESFQDSIKAYNNKDNDTTNDVRVGKTFWQRRPAQIGALVLAVILVFGLTEVLSNDQSNVKMPQLIIASIAALFYIGKVIVEAFPKHD